MDKCREVWYFISNNNWKTNSRQTSKCLTQYWIHHHRTIGRSTTKPKVITAIPKGQFSNNQVQAHKMATTQFRRSLQHVLMLVSWSREMSYLWTKGRSTKTIRQWRICFSSASARKEPTIRCFWQTWLSSRTNVKQPRIWERQLKSKAKVRSPGIEMVLKQITKPLQACVFKNWSAKTNPVTILTALTLPKSTRRKSKRSISTIRSTAKTARI